MLPQSMSGHGLAIDLGNTAAELFLTKSVPYLANKSVEMARYYFSEALSNPNLQKKAIDHALNKLNPSFHKVGYQALNGPDFDGGAIDIQKHLSKLGELHLRTLTGKKYNYCGPGTKLSETLNPLDSICKDHDIAYSKAGDDLSKKLEADNVMIKQIGDILFSQRPWFSTPGKYIMQTKRKLGLGVPKNGKSRRVKRKTGKKN